MEMTSDEFKVPDEKDINELALHNPLLYNCLQMGRQMGLTPEETMRLAVQELVRLCKVQHDEMLRMAQTTTITINKKE